MYCCSSTLSSSPSFGWALILCSRTRSRSRAMVILWKNTSIGIAFSCVSVLPGRSTIVPPSKRDAMRTSLSPSSSSSASLRAHLTAPRSRFPCVSSLMVFLSQSPRCSLRKRRVQRQKVDDRQEGLPPADHGRGTGRFLGGGVERDRETRVLEH